jgi:hypothetical protein
MMMGEHRMEAELSVMEMIIIAFIIFNDYMRYFQKNVIIISDIIEEAIRLMRFEFKHPIIDRMPEI